jgi:hypothetical protein
MCMCTRNSKVVVYQELKISGPYTKADFWCTRLMGTMFGWMLENPSTQTGAATANMKPHALRGLANFFFLVGGRASKLRHMILWGKKQQNRTC